ncbi:MAG TPA: tyrosine-type recombinase/integrase [Streptosporangiaceae bacterium]|jgi:site-specific recombinase XerD|nr:tyrosine-type recombinase/integrase [Streptosporangiaceae bacterium]
MGGDPSRVRVTGPLAVFAGGFTGELARLGYKPNAAADQLRLMAHLSRWMEAEQHEVAGLTPPAAEAFLAARRAAGYVMWLSPRALAPLLGYLRRLGAVPAPAPVPATPAEVLLGRYRCYLMTERGLASSTARDYAGLVRPFLVQREAGGLNLEQLTAAEVTAFVLDRCPHMGRGSAKLMVTALRSLLGFLHVSGMIAAPLGQAVPAVAHWRLAGLPKALEPGQVAALLASCNQDTAAGRRDFAMLTLLARLGLRAGEVAGLSLDDIGWRAGEITVRGKGSRAERLPLPADAGEAITAYLAGGRPEPFEGTRQVFLRARAPHRGLTSAGVTAAVCSAGHRAGIGQVFAHRLRHSAATGMLAAGAPLAEIGQVLRHRRLLSTAIYAKADIQALRALTRPWPTGGAA